MKDTSRRCPFLYIQKNSGYFLYPLFTLCAEYVLCKPRRFEDFKIARATEYLAGTPKRQHKRKCKTNPPFLKSDFAELKNLHRKVPPAFFGIKRQDEKKTTELETARKLCGARNHHNLKTIVPDLRQRKSHSTIGIALERELALRCQRQLPSARAGSGA